MNRLLDPRLEAVYEAVRPGAVAADVGCDHGRLICALVASGKCPCGFAADIGVQPLKSAKRLIADHGLSGRVRTMLSDGLKALPSQEIDDVVIAGMGGELIAKILTGVFWTRDKDKRFILQPMTRAPYLRRALYREGFELIDETAAKSGRFVYTVMAAAWTGERREVGELFAQTGLLWDSGDPSALLYLNRVHGRLEKQIAGLAKASSPSGHNAEPLRAVAAQIMERIVDQHV